MECSVYIGDPVGLERAFLAYDETRGMTITSEELNSCSVEAQHDLMAAFAAVRPQHHCSWAAAFSTVFSVLFWGYGDGERLRDAAWAIEHELVDSYLSPASVVRLAQLAKTIDLDDLNRAFAESDFHEDGWIQDFNDFRDMAGEWLDLLMRAAERKHALAIAVWD
jgi:hypothetical protein